MYKRQAKHVAFVANITFKFSFESSNHADAEKRGANPLDDDITAQSFLFGDYEAKAVIQFHAKDETAADPYHDDDIHEVELKAEVKGEPKLLISLLNPAEETISDFKIQEDRDAIAFKIRNIGGDFSDKTNNAVISYNKKMFELIDDTGDVNNHYYNAADPNNDGCHIANNVGSGLTIPASGSGAHYYDSGHSTLSGDYGFIEFNVEALKECHFKLKPRLYGELSELVENYTDPETGESRDQSFNLVTIEMFYSNSYENSITESLSLSRIHI